MLEKNLKADNRSPTSGSKTIIPHFGSSVPTALVTPRARRWLPLLLISFLAAWVLFRPSLNQEHVSPNVANNRTTNRASYPYLSLNLTHLYNNKAAGPGADFDPHSHGAYPAEHLPTGTFVYDNIEVRVPSLFGHLIRPYRGFLP